MTLTTLHLSQVPGRARHAVARPGHSVAMWRSALVSPASADFRATRVAASGNRYEGIAVPAGDMGFCTTPTTTKPSARHLGPRST